MSAAARWEACLFWAGEQRYYGSCWRHWGISGKRGGWYRIIHLPSGNRLTEFERLAHARRFCEAIDALTDWSQKMPPDEGTFGIRMHRIALRITGRPPDLRVTVRRAP